MAFNYANLFHYAASFIYLFTLNLKFNFSFKFKRKFVKKKIQICLNSWKQEIFLSIALSNQQLQWHFIKLSWKIKKKKRWKMMWKISWEFPSSIFSFSVYDWNFLPWGEDESENVKMFHSLRSLEALVNFLCHIIDFHDSWG